MLLLVSVLAATAISAAPARRLIAASVNGIVLVDPNSGEIIRRLTNHNDRRPLWSPDRQQVAFARGYLNSLEIHVVPRNGSRQLMLTNNDKVDQWPSWSPDSTRIAVKRWDNNSGDDGEIFIVKADGSGERNLTDDTAEQDCPDWGPDGKRIAFAQEGDIWTIKPDGTRPRQLTSSDQTLDNAPTWSPSGRAILFTRDVGVRDGERAEDLYVIKKDGTSLRRITRTPSEVELHYGWSPAGKRIAVVVSGNRDSLWTMRASGSRRRKIAGDIAPGGGGPTWSPSGRSLIYPKERRRDGVTYIDLWRVKVDGTNSHRLTHTSKWIEGPVWGRPLQQCRSPY